jgi:hypothetical protein
MERVAKPMIHPGKDISTLPQRSFAQHDPALSGFLVFRFERIEKFHAQAVHTASQSLNPATARLSVGLKARSLKQGFSSTPRSSTLKIPLSAE